MQDKHVVFLDKLRSAVASDIDLDKVNTEAKLETGKIKDFIEHTTNEIVSYGNVDDLHITVRLIMRVSELTNTANYLMEQIEKFSPTTVRFCQGSGTKPLFDRLLDKQKELRQTLTRMEII